MKLSGNRCQCVACGEYFNRVSTFDKHRVGDHETGRHCLTPEQMGAKEWKPNAKGFWVTKSRAWPTP